jgi:outer membrane cobalamin receptor
MTASQFDKDLNVPAPLGFYMLRAAGAEHCCRSRPCARFLLAVASACALSRGALAQTPQTPPLAPPTVAVTVDVIGTTPLPGVDLPLDKIPSPVQHGLARDIEESGALDLSDFLNRRMNGVYVNDVQGNPFQPDINYRGYTASPLLGTPQGLSVFMDGVRLNQPFGEVVSWDLIPRLAIASTTLMPGSNPLFGLNTLGGVLAIETKDGKAHPGTSVQATFGSHLRRAVEFEHGASRSSGLNCTSPATCSPRTAGANAPSRTSVSSSARLAGAERRRTWISRRHSRTRN